MKEQIVMSKNEYETQKDKIKEKLIRELEYKYKYIKSIEIIPIIILFGWLLPKLSIGFNEFPKLTMFCFGFASIFYCIMVYTYINMWRNRKLQR